MVSEVGPVYSLTHKQRVGVEFLSCHNPSCFVVDGTYVAEETAASVFICPEDGGGRFLLNA
jgi:hypothetical protein